MLYIVEWKDDCEWMGGRVRNEKHRSLYLQGFKESLIQGHQSAGQELKPRPATYEVVETTFCSGSCHAKSVKQV